MERGIKVIYTAPIKALSNQKYKEFSREYGEEKIGILTGDTVKNPTAPVLIMTTEIYRNMLVDNDPLIKCFKDRKELMDAIDACLKNLPFTSDVDAHIFEKF